jgi:hypothetical protein
MSDDLNVKLYFGNWHIRYGEHGVDLSEFDSVDHVIRRAASRTWGSITEFFRTFHVDAEKHDLSIMALINRSESLYRELMPLQDTEHWRSYIKTSCEIGSPVMLFIQVVHKAGSSSQVPESDARQGEEELQAGDGPTTEPQEGDGGSSEEEEGDGDTPFEGAIDEGEVNEEVLRRYEMEADGDERGLEEHSSDDEDDPLVPRDWDRYNFSQLSVNPGENMSWEYRDNAVSVGAMYKNAVEVKDAVKRWATLTLQREFRVVKSSPHIYDVQFLKPNCPFQVYAF